MSNGEWGIEDKEWTMNADEEWRMRSEKLWEM